MPEIADGARLRYRPEATGGFMASARASLQRHLDDRGDHRGADARMWLKGAALALLAGGLYAAMLLARSRALFLATGAGAVIVATLFAANVLHDVAHGVFVRSPTRRRIVLRLGFLPLGLDGDIWVARHVALHHAGSNVEGVDLDISPNPFLRQTDAQPWYPLHRVQHRSWPFLAMMALPWVAWVNDIADQRGRTGMARLLGAASLPGWPLLLATKLAHVALMLALPAWAAHAHGLDAGLALVAWAIGQAVSSLFVMTMLLGTHWVDPAYFDAPADGRLPHGWAEHAFLTAVDWTPRPHWLTALTGGLHLHLAHHLFPQLAHRHLPAAAAIAERLAPAHGLRYRRVDWSGMWAAQQRYLRAMGVRPGEDTADR